MNECRILLGTKAHGLALSLQVARTRCCVLASYHAYCKLCSPSFCQRSQHAFLQSLYRLFVRIPCPHIIKDEIELIMNWLAIYTCICYAGHTSDSMDKYSFYMLLVVTLLVAILVAANVAQRERAQHHRRHHLGLFNFAA